VTRWHCFWLGVPVGWLLAWGMIGLAVLMSK
jgi:hypothetical protein